jgi:UPF0271 protein
MVKNGDKCYILDASAFIGGFEPINSFNFTVSEITEEIKDLKSKMILNDGIEDSKIFIKEVNPKYYEKLEKIILKSGDNLRLSTADKKLLALSLEFLELDHDLVVVTDDYSIQNVLKILKIPFDSVLTEGITEVYNWKKVCEGCKKEFSDDYLFKDCEVCGSKIFKKRIKTNKKD